MANQVRRRLLLGSLLLLKLGCWGEEFRECKGEACTASTTGGISGTNSVGGSGGSGGTGGSTSNSSTGTSGASGTSSVGGTGGSLGDGGAAGDPGVGGSAGAGGSPPECDGVLLPEDDWCVVDEAYGVFVSPEGDDATGEGTREAPFATLQKAADVASESGKRVYACSTGGDYSAGLTLGEAHDGLEVYGSFSCADWNYASAFSSTVAPEAEVPLRVSGIDTSLHLTGFDFVSADATEPGASSIAAEIRDSSGVVLRNVTLLAGAGANGAPGETVEFSLPGPNLLNGANATEDEPGVMSPVACPAGDSTRGGSGGTTAPSDGSAGTPNYVGPGGEGGSVGVCVPGDRGASGPNGGQGEGADTVGALISGSWVPESGGDGGPGLAGQGGGGGAGAATGGGGSGGAGGCGGAGGGGGGGAGASIALLLVDAEVALIDSAVSASHAGHGGSGSSGQLGQPGGTPALGFAGGCPGRDSGLGGNGGPGGGGAGGISVGILLQDATTMQTNTEVTAGGAGIGGTGSGTDNTGVPGFAQAELDVAEL